MIDSTGATLGTIRVARGLSQKDLAVAAGITQGFLSKLEAGAVPLDSEKARVLAEALGVRPGIFGVNISHDARIFHRKLASLPIKADKRLRAESALLQSQVSSLLGGDLPSLTLERDPLPDDDMYTPSDIARRLRSRWKLGTGPIDDLVAVAESHGILVVIHDMQTLRLDAIATWPAGGAPVIFLADHAPADRQRFTMAHEIGHAVMHELPTIEQESEADQFASEFLMPAATIRSELSDVSLKNLAALKRRWGVSIAALARRARDLSLMSDNQYKNFNIYMSSSGMKKREPVELPVHEPRLIHDLLDQRLAEGRTIDELATAAWMTENELKTRFLEHR
ncbi:Zn-dependent peptidase ImmA (M78 family) [Rhodoglobus vestalii]|uniref:Zn-dependent peptidase ImmA (M78 family) n=1 Tax=Rhodoglobus vestalii TaxID=193384 RepID=A0A8H2K876_9MICO|nr:XRE family transcriptional regulator [Rhodoglobus vestalii]TQO18526.1 Zn-dependent peptidase ImmA (M78 family) [Rhodoglobus vestalii]